MNKLIFTLLIFASVIVNGQTKNKNSKTTNKTAESSDTLAVAPEPEKTPFELLEESLPREVEIDPNTGKKIFYKERK